RQRGEEEEKPPRWRVGLVSRTSPRTWPPGRETRSSPGVCRFPRGAEFAKKVVCPARVPSWLRAAVGRRPGKRCAWWGNCMNGIQNLKEKGDFTAEVRLLWISLLALVIGGLCAVVAQLLLWLIAFFANLFYYQQVSLQFHSPADAVANNLGLISIIIPVIG